MCAKARHKPLHPPPAVTGSVFVVAKIQIPLGQCTMYMYYSFKSIKSNHLYDLTITVRYVCLLSSDIQQWWENTHLHHIGYRNTVLTQMKNFSGLLDQTSRMSGPQVLKVGPVSRNFQILVFVPPLGPCCKGEMFSRMIPSDIQQKCLTQRMDRGGHLIFSFFRFSCFPKRLSVFA